MSALDGVPHLRYVEVATPTGDVSVADTGRAPERQGAPVLLIHGTGGKAETHFADLLPMLSFRRRVIAPDLANPPDGATPTVEHFSAQVEAILDELSPDEPVHLLGYSLGAAVATAVAAERPDRVASLTLLCGWLVTDREQSIRNGLALALEEQDIDLLAQLLVFTTYGAPYLAKRQAWELDRLHQNFRNRVSDSSDWRGQMELNRVLDISDFAYRVQAPTLVVGARYDKTAPLHHSKLLFGAIEDARYVEVSTGHGVLTERSSEIYWLVEQFTENPQLTPAGAVWENAPLSVLTEDGFRRLPIPPSAPVPHASQTGSR